jgi:hypothetical protein
MNIYVDIDETICYYEGEREYQYAISIPENIEKINKLYDEGNTITYWTARGSVHKDRIPEYEDLTLYQLTAWGAKFHKLIVGEKPAYDLIICDKSRRIEEI